MRTTSDDATVVGTQFGTLRRGSQTREAGFAVWRNFVETKSLEKRVEALETLPARVNALELQISEFRAEVRAEFSATRTELRQEMRARGDELGSELRSEMRSLNDATRAEMRSLNDATRAEMRSLNADTLTQMRVLHEDVITRFELLDEHAGRKRSSAPRRRKR